MSIQLSGNLFIYSPRIFTRFTSSDITLPVAGGEMVWLCCHGSVVHLVLSSEDVGLREGTLWLQPTELASHGAGPGIWGLCSFLGSSWIWEAVVTTWWLLPPAMLGEGTCAKHSDVPSASSQEYVLPPLHHPHLGPHRDPPHQNTNQKLFCKYLFDSPPCLFPGKYRSSFSFFLFYTIYSFIWLCWVFVVARAILHCGAQAPG